MSDSIQEKLKDKSLSREELAGMIIADPSMIPQIIEGVSSDKADIRYGCATALKMVSETKPELLYPYFDFFAGLLSSKYRILVWIGIIGIANLAPFDDQKKFDRICDEYFKLMDSGYMVTAANIVGNSGKIALAKPYLADRITKELLRTRKLKTGPHLTPECRRIISEHAIRSFDLYFNEIKNKDEVISFAKACMKSRRKNLQVIAAEFVKKRSQH